MSVEDFAKRFKDELGKGKTSSVPERESSALEVIVLEVSADMVQFGHLNRRFSVRRQDVVDLVESTRPMPNPFGAGVPGSLILKSDAEVTSFTSFRAADLIQGLPFAIARPSFTPSITLPQHTPREQAWLQRMDFQSNELGVPRAAGTWSETQSPKWSPTRCDTRSDGMADDNNSDDGQGDEHYNDDSRQDD
jgi:hypothetical protein